MVYLSTNMASSTNFISYGILVLGFQNLVLAGMPSLFFIILFYSQIIPFIINIIKDLFQLCNWVHFLCFQQHSNIFLCKLKYVSSYNVKTATKNYSHLWILNLLYKNTFPSQTKIKEDFNLEQPQIIPWKPFSFPEKQKCHAQTYLKG